MSSGALCMDQIRNNIWLQRLLSDVQFAMGRTKISYAEAAEWLNERGLKAPNGKPITKSYVGNWAAGRIKIPLAISKELAVLADPNYARPAEIAGIKSDSYIQIPSLSESGMAFTVPKMQIKASYRSMPVSTVSAKPHIVPRDLVIVDTARTSPSDDRIFAYRRDDDRRIQFGQCRIENDHIVYMDASTWTDEEPIDESQILGEVVGIIQRYEESTEHGSDCHITLNQRGITWSEWKQQR